MVLPWGSSWRLATLILGGSGYALVLGTSGNVDCEKNLCGLMVICDWFTVVDLSICGDMWQKVLFFAGGCYAYIDCRGTPWLADFRLV